MNFEYWLEYVKVEEFHIHSHMVTVMKELQGRRRRSLRDLLEEKEWEPSYLDMYQSQQDTIEDVQWHCQNAVVPFMLEVTGVDDQLKKKSSDWYGENCTDS